VARRQPLGQPRSNGGSPRLREIERHAEARGHVATAASGAPARAASALLIATAHSAGALHAGAQPAASLGATVLASLDGSEERIANVLGTGADERAGLRAVAHVSGRGIDLTHVVLALCGDAAQRLAGSAERSVAGADPAADRPAAKESGTALRAGFTYVESQQNDRHDGYNRKTMAHDDLLL